MSSSRQQQAKQATTTSIMSKTIVIIGATGTQGSAVAHTFLQLPNWHVRGITRNPASAASQALTAKGVQIIKADIDDKASLLPAFAGAAVIFSNTDFFAHLQHALSRPGITGSGSGTGTPEEEEEDPNKYAYTREVEQGVNIAEAAASPAVLKTLERFIYSSLPDPRKCSAGRYNTVWHYNSKADTLAAINSRFPDLAARTSILWVGYYTSMWKMLPHVMAPLKQADGSFKTIRQTKADLKVPFAVPERDTGVFVKALVFDLPPRKILLGMSEYLTWPEWMELWGRILGVEAGFEQVSKEAMFAGLPGAMRRDLEEGYDFVDEFGFTGGDADVLVPDQLPVKLPVTSMEEYIKSEDWSSVLDA
ncbi:hypothetical protein BJX70DRAFT_384223 [Aspergillus crustosus]